MGLIVAAHRQEPARLASLRTLLGARWASCRMLPLCIAGVVACRQARKRASRAWRLEASISSSKMASLAVKAAAAAHRRAGGRSAAQTERGPRGAPLEAQRSNVRAPGADTLGPPQQAAAACAVALARWGRAMARSAQAAVSPAPSSACGSSKGRRRARAPRAVRPSRAACLPRTSQPPRTAIAARSAPRPALLQAGSSGLGDERGAEQHPPWATQDPALCCFKPSHRERDLSVASREALQPPPFFARPGRGC
ncbi:hypothetical protein FA09DRAFT_106118 [Tilletiopsis washingtonensis]|jgi:hypothetical protein|uniref:Uncharacterized protein n=1 Tax=Tilletiopsis washingtonensis TaxID=58919 RepID=A0A316Z3Y3_9BASI|nr:hypothetical protein FA09DRAFT_106118 [Tilletiopsis washingtonensis]PWN96086.1 hypothetical protein FA09DRAFT_106118 [Tilletiopsis washingtonensis]